MTANTRQADDPSGHSQQIVPVRDPRQMPGALWKAFVAAAAIATMLVAAVATLANQPYRAPVRPIRELRPELYLTATEAFRAGRWDEARQAFETLLDAVPQHPRALDFLDRLDAVASESERLARAEEALVGARLDEAERLAASVPPNSPLFAQAEALARVVRNPEGGAPERAAGDGEGDSGPTVDLSSVLQQALALYNAGRFEEAVERASELAAEADGPAREELERWARRCARFGAVYLTVPKEGALGGTLLARATQALAWDRQLGGGHARELRPRVVSAYMALIDAAWERGDEQGACARWVEGQQWEPRPDEWEKWPDRCAAAAARLLAKAKPLELSKPEQAIALYRQVVRMVPATSGTYTDAREALAGLTWTEDR